MSKIKILEVTENEDGSANVELELSDEAKQMLLEEGFNSVIKKYIENYEKTLDKP